MNRPLLALVFAAVALAIVGTAHATTLPTARDADVNDDLRVNSTDQLLVGQHFTNSHPYDAQFDVNLDLHVDSVDQLLQSKCFNRYTQWNFNACIDQVSTPAYEGLNNWGLAQQDGFESGCGYNGQNTREAKLTLFAQKKVQAVRILATQWHARKAGVRDWTVLDDTFARAQSHGVRLVVAMENHWGDCNGTTKTCAWYQTGYQTGYDGLSVGFNAWTTEVVTRYSGHPALAAWEVMNEPWASTACIHGFFVDMVARIKAADAVTPISLGGNDSGGWDFKTENQIPGVTWTTVHGPYNDPTALTAFQQQRITWSQEIGKPIYVGERGYAVCPDTAMRDFYNAAIPAAENAGAIGFLAWAFSYNDPLDDCDLDFGPNSPVMGVFSSLTFTAIAP